MKYAFWTLRIARRQRGAALVEFAFVLPFLLAMLVGTIYYGYAFMLKAAVTHAAQEGAKVAVAVDPAGLSTEDYKSVVRREAGQAVRNSLDWLPDVVESNLEETQVNFAGDRVNVRVRLATAGGGGGLLPQADLPVVGAVPPLPATLVGVAEVGL